MMAYKKGHHCNNKCKFFYGSYETVYNNHHGGVPGSTDYEVYVMSCDAKEVTLTEVRYSCPIYQVLENESEE